MCLITIFGIVFVNFLLNLLSFSGITTFSGTLSTHFLVLSPHKNSSHAFPLLLLEPQMPPLLLARPSCCQCMTFLNICSHRESSAYVHFRESPGHCRFLDWHDGANGRGPCLQPACPLILSVSEVPEEQALEIQEAGQAECQCEVSEEGSSAWKYFPSTQHAPGPAHDSEARWQPRPCSWGSQATTCLCRCWAAVPRLRTGVGGGEQWLPAPRMAAWNETSIGPQRPGMGGGG